MVSVTRGPAGYSGGREGQCHLACRYPFQYADTKRANIAGARALRGAGTHFAHSVTILASGID
jgi:hypothetical protein